MAQVVWLARHGNRQDFADPEWRDRAERPHDPGLAEDGIVQAKALGQHLCTEEVRHLFASPFLRTVETAHYVAEVLALPIRLVPGLGEWMNPKWFDERPEPLSPEELARRFPRVELLDTSESRSSSSYPETKAEAFARIGRTTRRLVRACTGPLLLIGHGVTVVGAAQELTGADDFETALCSLTKLVHRDGEWVMTRCADVEHLPEKKGAGRLH